MFRLPIYKNKLLTGLVLVELTASIVLVLYNWSFANSFFGLTGDLLPTEYRVKILVMGLGFGLCFMLYERYFVPHKSLDPDPVEQSPPGEIIHQQDEEGEGDEGDDKVGGGGGSQCWKVQAKH